MYRPMQRPLVTDCSPAPWIATQPDTSASLENPAAADWLLQQAKPKAFHAVILAEFAVVVICMECVYDVCMCVCVRVCVHFKFGTGNKNILKVCVHVVCVCARLYAEVNVLCICVCMHVYKYV